MLNIENMPSKRKPRQRVMWYCYVQWRIQNFEKGRPGSHYGPWLGVRRQSRPGKLGMRWIYRSWTVLLIWQSTLTPILQLLIIILSLSLPVFHAFSALIFAFSALTVLFVGCQEEHPSCKKKWVMRCWRGYLSGERYKWLTYGPADGTATLSSLASLESRLV